jgi:hypothetical protein
MHSTGFSFITLFLMLAIFFASSAIFHFLSLRWTRDRRLAAMEDWAQEHGFKLRTAPDAELAPALQSLHSLNAQVEFSLRRDSLVLNRITTRNGNSVQAWNVLIRETEVSRAPAGFRPRSRPHSFLDLFSLTDFPAISPSERFLICAIDSRAAREIAKSSARGLLPPDVGLIVHGQFITLDFSNRPFDTIEFERLLVVMDQIQGHLPAA